MKLLLDDQDVVLAQPSLAEALRVGVQEAGKRGRIVVEATMDGRPLDDEQLVRPSDALVPGAEVRLVTAEPRSLVRMTLMEVADRLPEAQRIQKTCAEALERGEAEATLPELGEALGIWQSVRDAVAQGAELLGIPLDEVRLGGDGAAGFAGSMQDLTLALEEVRRCLKAEDWASLADLLAFELDELADRWQSVVRALADYVREG
jgi:hypothetical protein